MKFIERHVRIISDPLYGDISDLAFGMTESKVANRPNSHQRNRINANSFATNIAPMEPMENNGEWRNASQGHDSAVELGCACSFIHYSSANSSNR